MVMLLLESSSLDLAVFAWFSSLGVVRVVVVTFFVTDDAGLGRGLGDW